MTNFSVIVPTYREASNITQLITRIANLNLDPHTFEVILMDDNSQDGIVELVATLKTTYPWLKLIVRHGEKGLSAAVLEGFQHAQHPVLVVMDADLSHPPEKILELVTTLTVTQADIVIGSRYVPGGSVEEKWPLRRRIFSRASAELSKLVIATKIHDPLSGFIALRKDLLAAHPPLKAIGWKIGLEIMVKCHCKKIIEVPICFSERQAGVSKLNVKIAWNYLRHLQQLGLYRLQRYLIG